MHKRKSLHYFAGSLLTLIGISAVFPGIIVFLYPDGSALDISVDVLSQSPFENFLIPGIFLFIVNGLGSLLGALLCFKLHPLSGKITILLGILMIIWIIVQVYWIGWLIWLQPLFLVIGVLEVILGLLIEKNNPSSVR